MVQDYRDKCKRIETELQFNLGKQKCGIELVTEKLEDKAAQVDDLSVLLLNLCKIKCAFLYFLEWLFGFLLYYEKLMVIQ